MSAASKSGTKPSTVAEFLAEHDGFGVDPATAPRKKLEAWLREVDRHSRAGARAAYLVGRVLLAQRPKHGKVAEWTDHQAQRLARSPRTLRLYMQVAAAIDADSATPLPIWILDRPLRDVPRVIRAIRAGKDPDAKAQPSRQRAGNKTQQWRKRAKDLLASIPRGNRKALLEAHFLAVYQQLVKLDPTLAPPDAPADVMEFAVAAAAHVQRDKPLPLSVVNTRKKIPPIYRRAGGKYHVVNSLIQRIGVLPADGLNGDHVFREPFVGGGSVMLNMLESGRAKRVWINDADAGVVAVWNAIIREPEQLIRRVTSVEVTDRTMDRLWAAVEGQDLAGVDLAVAEIVLSQCNWGGFGRMVSSPRRNPRSRWHPRTIARRIDTVHRLLRGRVVFNECTQLDACEIIAAPGPCFMYLDPPYVEQGPMLYPVPFDEAKHRELAAALKAASQPWLLSYDDHPLIRDLYADQVISTLTVPGQHHQSKDELLICSRRYPDILKPDTEPDLIGDLFGTECEVP